MSAHASPSLDLLGADPVGNAGGPLTVSSHLWDPHSIGPVDPSWSPRAGDRVLALPRRCGGHGLARWQALGCAVTALAFDAEAHDVDYPQVAEQLEALRPQWLIAGLATWLFPHELDVLREACGRCGTRLLIDLAAVEDLVIGGLFQQELRASAPDRVGLARAMVSSALGLALALESEGVRVLFRHRGWTRSHTLVLWRPQAARAVETLAAAGLQVRSTALAWDGAGARSGLVISTRNLVRQGLGPQDMPRLASGLAGALAGLPPDRLRRRLAPLLDRSPTTLHPAGRSRPAHPRRSP